MKTELVKELLDRFEDACFDFNGVECWSARDLQEILGYSEWRNFQNAIGKAKEACSNVGEQCEDHFLDVSRTTVDLPNNAAREIDDVALTRYAYHPAWQDFLTRTTNGYFALGGMDLNIAFSIPLDVIQSKLPELNTTTKNGNTYWHIQIQQPDGGDFRMQCQKTGKHLDLAPHVINI